MALGGVTVFVTEASLQLGEMVQRRKLDEDKDGDRHASHGRRPPDPPRCARAGNKLDRGKREGQGVAPLVARSVFPEEWRIVLIIPPWGQGLHGDGENAAFHSLVSRQFSATLTDTLCRLALLGMLPALIEHDWHVFGEVIYEFNARVGEAFKPVQKGIYADPRIAELISFIRRQGIPGAGQSSWGPTVFALADDDSRAADLASRIRNQFGLSAQAILSTRACNQGADSTADAAR